MKSHLLRIRVDEELMERLASARRHFFPEDINPHNQGKTVRKLLELGLEAQDKKRSLIDGALAKLTPAERKALGK